MDPAEHVRVSHSQKRLTESKVPCLNNDAIFRLCQDEIFSAVALITLDEVVFESSFRPYCEQNLCGKYGANYSCPPDCGTPEEMEARMRQYRNALVFQTKWDIDDWYDNAQIKRAKKAHNEAMLRVIERMKQRGYQGLMGGASCCSLCERCTRLDDAPCPFPVLRYSCLSAYCVYVRKLADACGMEYACKDGRLAFFGLYAF